MLVLSGVCPIFDITACLRLRRSLDIVWFEEERCERSMNSPDRVCCVKNARSAFFTQQFTYGERRKREHAIEFESDIKSRWEMFYGK